MVQGRVNLSQKDTSSGASHHPSFNSNDEGPLSTAPDITGAFPGGWRIQYLFLTGVSWNEYGFAKFDVDPAEGAGEEFLPMASDSITSFVVRAISRADECRPTSDMAMKRP